jgi:hypothetical protein
MMLAFLLLVGQGSNTASSSGVPPAPSISAAANGTTGITLTLIAAPESTTLAVQRRSPSGSGGYTVILTGLRPSEFPVTATGLLPNTNYGFQVRGTNAIGTGGFSTEASATTAANAATPSVFVRTNPGRGD